MVGAVERWKQVRVYRGQIPSPGAPTVAWREDRVRFWAAIARGIKTEIGIEAWPDRASARRDIENRITSYNERRLHSALAYRTPTETRRAWQDRMTTAA